MDFRVRFRVERSKTVHTWFFNEHLMCEGFHN